MAKSTSTTRPVRTVSTTDMDVISIISAFKNLKGYTNNSEALEKLLMRAERLNLHKLPDSDFDAILEAVSAAA